MTSKDKEQGYPEVEVTIVSKDEAFYTKCVEKSKQAIESLESELRINKDFLETFEKKLLLAKKSK